MQLLQSRSLEWEIEAGAKTSLKKASFTSLLHKGHPGYICLPQHIITTYQGRTVIAHHRGADEEVEMLQFGKKMPATNSPSSPLLDLIGRGRVDWT